MKESDLQSMSVDELWSLHEETVAALAHKIIVEKARLEQRLHELGQDNGSGAKKLNHARRPYPQVFPKCRTRRDLGRSRQAAALALGTAPLREEARRFPDPAGVASRPASRRIRGGNIVTGSPVGRAISRERPSGVARRMQMFPD
jgi:hypothetical protein